MPYIVPIKFPIIFHNQRSTFLGTYQGTDSEERTPRAGTPRTRNKLKIQDRGSKDRDPKEQNNRGIQGTRSKQTNSKEQTTDVKKKQTTQSNL